MTSTQILRLIGANIRTARLEANLTQEGLAELADIHWKTLGYIESGKRDFGAATLAKLALALNLPFNRVLDGIRLDKSAHMAVVSKATARKRQPSKKAKVTSQK